MRRAQVFALRGKPRYTPASVTADMSYVAESQPVLQCCWRAVISASWLHGLVLDPLTVHCEQRAAHKRQQEYAGGPPLAWQCPMGHLLRGTMQLSCLSCLCEVWLTKV